MNHQLVGRNQRTKGGNMKQALQFIVFLVGFIWLLYQITNSSDNSEKIETNVGKKYGVLSLGRKGRAGGSDSEDINFGGESGKRDGDDGDEKSHGHVEYKVEGEMPYKENGEVNEVETKPRVRHRVENEGQGQDSSEGVANENSHQSELDQMEVDKEKNTQGESGDLFDEYKDGQEESKKKESKTESAANSSVSRTVYEVNGFQDVTGIPEDGNGTVESKPSELLDKEENSELDKGRSSENNILEEVASRYGDAKIVGNIREVSRDATPDAEINSESVDVDASKLDLITETSQSDSSV